MITNGKKKKAKWLPIGESGQMYMGSLVLFFSNLKLYKRTYKNILNISKQTWNTTANSAKFGVHSSPATLVAEFYHCFLVGNRIFFKIM